MKTRIGFVVVNICLIAVLSLAAAAPVQAATWGPSVAYKIGDVVTYQGLDYRCVQSHTSRVGWEPPNVPALWHRLPGATNEWQPWTSYTVNMIVMFQDANYRCLQSHTSQPDWEPPNVATLWVIHSVPDPVLHWNAIMLQADATDHTGTFGPPRQFGPTRSSRAFAMVHAAIFDAVNSIDRTRNRYLTLVAGAEDAAVDPAVATAAHRTLVSIYPNQQAIFDRARQNHLSLIPNGAPKTEGIQVGTTVANAVLNARANDGSSASMTYTPSNLPGRHRVDPLNPNQGFFDPRWGSVRPFVVQSGSQFRSPAPPALTSSAYTAAFNEAKNLGGDGIHTPTQRTLTQTHIGIYWAYDKSPKIGTPPRLYNQIARTIAIQRGNNLVRNARLFGLINLAMADAGINAWESKYFYSYWRPILGIRQSDPGTGPTGAGDGNPNTVGDIFWRFLGSPASNQPGVPNFTPPFPAYPSGHASFGSALFRMLERYFATANISFTFVSDELNGITTDNNGNVRPRVPRTFSTLTAAKAENAQSRIYLGVHWQFDAQAGINQGNALADFVFNNALR